MKLIQETNKPTPYFPKLKGHDPLCRKTKKESHKSYEQKGIYWEDQEAWSKETEKGRYA